MIQHDRGAEVFYSATGTGAANNRGLVGGAAMTHIQFLRIKKLTDKNHIQVAAKHNHREILAEMGAAQGGKIDPSRTGHNIILRGQSTATGVASEAQSLMDDAGVKSLRKDAVRALEIIFSLPSVTAIDHRRYFDDATQWTEHYFEAPVISAIIHNDEAAPHCHVLILPLVHGRMIGSDLMGGRAKLQALQADFYAKVGQGYGLARQAPQKRLSTVMRRVVASIALDGIKENWSLLCKPEVSQALIGAIERDPEPLMLALGLAMPKEKLKGSFVAIMTKPCKPEKPIGFTRSKPIGFDAVVTPAKEQTLFCVGFAISPQPISAVIEQQGDAGRQIGTSQPKHREDMEQDNFIQDDYIRQRDAEQPAGYWDETTGDFIKPMVKASCKQAVMASVNSALESIGVSRRAPARVMRC